MAPAADSNNVPPRLPWRETARPNQLPPPDPWTIWLILAGRGWGKTRTGAEWVCEQVAQGKARRVALMGRTAADVRDVMVEGESGILAVSPSDARPRYEPSKRRLTWPNGALATTYSADEPDSLRGPQHDGGWADELASWDAPEAWSNFLFGLRLGRAPQAVVTTTPKPVPLLKELVARAGVVITRGSTYENLANLAPTFIEQIVAVYEGTRLGRQELNAELLDDNPDALWKRPMIDDARCTAHPPLTRIVVAVDPSATATGDAAGIIVAGRGTDNAFYVLADYSLQASPNGWAQEAVSAYHKWHADRLVAETNNGGEMVEGTIRTVDPHVAYTAVHASRGKLTRAEPVAALYEQGRGHHVGAFPALEDELCTWMPGMASPNRLDALVWAGHDLFPLTHHDGWAAYIAHQTAARAAQETPA